MKHGKWLVVVVVAALAFTETALGQVAGRYTWRDVLNYLGTVPQVPDTFVWVEKYTLSNQTGYKVYRRYLSNTYLQPHVVFKHWLFPYGRKIDPTEGYWPVDANGQQQSLLANKANCNWTTTSTSEYIGTSPPGWVKIFSGLVPGWPSGGSGPRTEVERRYNCFGNLVESFTTAQTVSGPQSGSFMSYVQDELARQEWEDADYENDYQLSVPASCPIHRALFTGRTAGSCKSPDTLLRDFYPADAGSCMASGAYTAWVNGVNYRVQSDCSCIPDGYRVAFREGTTCWLLPTVGDPAEPNGVTAGGLPAAAGGDLVGTSDQGGNGGGEGNGGGGWSGGGPSTADISSGVSSGIGTAAAPGTQPAPDTNVQAPAESSVFSLVTNWIAQHPLVSVFQGTGVVVGAVGQCHLNLPAMYGFGQGHANISFCAYQSHFQLMGTILVGLAGIYALYIIVTGG